MKTFINDLFRNFFGKANNKNVYSGDYAGNGSGVVRGVGPVIETSRQTSHFDKVEVDGAISVKINVGGIPDFGVIIRAQENIENLIKTEVHGDTLGIYVDESYSSSQEVTVIVGMSSISACHVRGACNVHLHELNEEKISIEVSGSADIVANGVANELNVDVSGSASLDLAKVTSRKLTADVSGSAHVQGHATETARIDVSGSASIVITGQPKRRQVDRSGSADVIFV